MTGFEKFVEWDKKYFMPIEYTIEEYTPFPITRVEGNYLFDDKGNRILDMMGQLTCTNLGQRHPKVVEEIKKALDNFGFVWEAYLTQYRAEASKLIMEDILGPDKWAGRVRFVSTGSEAVEEALMIAKLYTNRPYIITREFAYHGWNSGGTRLRKDRNILRSPRTGEIRSLPGEQGGFFIAPPPYCYRCSIGHEYPSCKVKGQLSCVLETEKLIRTLGPENVAGIITEVFFGAGTIGGIPQEYTSQIREMTRRLGILWIDDEVLCGFGRTGKWFAYQHFLPATPDIMTLGKGIVSSQLPAAGVVVSKDIAKFFEGYRWGHVSTYASHPVCMAAVVANIKVMMDEDLINNAARMGSYLGERLKELEDKHKCVGQVSGIGLTWTVEVVKNKETKEPFIEADRYDCYVGDSSEYPGNIVLQKCLERGVLCGGFVPNSVRISPNLSIKEHEIDKAVEALDYAFTELDKKC